MAVMLARAVAIWVPSTSKPPDATYYAPWLEARATAGKPSTDDELLMKFKLLSARQSQAQ